MNENKPGKAEEILECASRLFAQKGFEGVSVRDICNELGVNCSTVSYYFGGKKNLYLKVLQRQFAVHEETLKELADKNLSPDQELPLLVDAFRLMHEKCPHLSALMAREASAPGPEYRQVIREHESGPYGNYLSNLIIKGQKQGLFDHRLEPLTLSIIMGLLLNGQAMAGSAAKLSRPGINFKEEDYYETVKSLLGGGLGLGGEDGRARAASRPLGKKSASMTGGRSHGF